jgi:predicted CxxxxCH...CXXCH cytochrome family protein
VSPTWDAARRTCTNYCHGASLQGGIRTAPVWNGGSGEAACGSCHGVPPALETGHPFVAGAGATGCGACHAPTVRPDGTIDLAGGRHVNGALDVGEMGCASCHGGTLSGSDAGGVSIAPAPPRGTRGETSRSARAVGAHVAHHTNRITTSARCVDCHGPMPAANDHRDGTVQLPFSGLASGTVWNGTTCTSSYCHRQSPMTWAAPAQAPLGCGGCHATGHDWFPHSGGDACNICHPHVSEFGDAILEPALHINGQVELSDCVGCHPPI